MAGKQDDASSSSSSFYEEEEEELKGKDVEEEQLEKENEMNEVEEDELDEEEGERDNDDDDEGEAADEAEETKKRSRIKDNGCNDDEESSEKAKQRKKNKIEDEDAEHQDADNTETKYFSIQKIWSPEDENLLLKGMLDFKRKKGINPNLNMKSFSSFVLKVLTVKATEQKIKRKIRSLKKKFLNNSKRARNGGDPTFSKSHALKQYELSKKIWGAIGNDHGYEANNVRGKQNVQGHQCLSESVMKFCENIIMPTLGLGETLFKKNDFFIETSKAKELDCEFRKLIVAQIEIHLMSLELAREKTQLALDALKSSMPQGELD